MQYGSDNVLRLLLKRRIGGSHGFKRILFCCPFLQMQAYAYGKNKEMQECRLKYLLPAFVDVGDVPLVGQLAVAERIAEDVLNR